MPKEKDIIRDTLREETNLSEVEVQRIARLIRERIEKAANVFQDNPAPDVYPPNRRG